MKVAVDRKTHIVGLGLTDEAAEANMRFYVERGGELSLEHELKRKEMHTWIPTPSLIQVKGVGAIQYKEKHYVNLRTGRKVRAYDKPLSHYLCLYSAFDGYLSFEDFTLTLSREINRYVHGIFPNCGKLDEFPYIKPVEHLDIKYMHKTLDPDLLIMESTARDLVVSYQSGLYQVDKTVGVDMDCLLAYVLASIGYVYDGHTLERTKGE